MTSTAHALEVPVFTPESAMPARTERDRLGADIKLPVHAASPGVVARRLRLATSSLARTADRPVLAAVLLDLDRRRRRAQIAARHAVDGVPGVGFRVSGIGCRVPGGQPPSAADAD